ncbi:MAG: holliday junction helicase RuvA [Actinomycetota bacterium]|nr:holliday junction helicase RuvA [Actinomycetota bacterium]
MIASVRGLCVAIAGDAVVVEVGGIGLQLTCTPGALAGIKVGSECRLATAFIVREDGWSLYGFADDDERQLFDQLQTVAGVGPRMALATVGTLGAPELVRAIGSADLASLTAVSGVGKKTAERMVLELREKVGSWAVVAAVAAPVAAGAAGGVGWQRQVLEGLIGLGWQPRDADEAVRAVAVEVKADGLDTADVGALLRRALTRLDRV